tara:strand:+ start:4171 stop:4845 length:675 start_codon:yes stop_codon:yes gene_type:complete
MLLTLNDKEYLVPQKWTQVSLESYQKLMQYVGDEGDEHTKSLTTIHSLTGAPIDVLEKCKKSDIQKLLKAVSNLLEVKVNTTLNMVIEVEGVEYGFHPNLREITFAEFVDLDNYLSEPWENMHRIMSVLYRPITTQNKKKYKIEEYDSTKCMQTAEVFKKALSVATVNGASNFFLTIAGEYLSVLQSSLSKKQKKMLKDTEIQNKSLVKNGVGMELSTTSQMAK